MDRPTERLSSRAVAHAAGVSFRQLNYWVAKGVLAPRYTPEVRGPGSVWRWSIDQVAQARVAGALASLGATVTELAVAVGHLAADPSLLDEPTLFVDRTGAVHPSPVGHGWYLRREAWLVPVG
jgi:DNA-binding transcriptional MerR regulator